MFSNVTVSSIHPRVINPSSNGLHRITLIKFLKTVSCNILILGYLGLGFMPLNDVVSETGFSLI